MLNWRLWLGVLGLAVFGTQAFAQTGFANMVDHIHLGVPDPVQGVAWYHEHFGGETMTEGPDRLMFGATRMIFQRTEKPVPSSGSVLDHLGFSVADLDATMKRFEEGGVKIALVQALGTEHRHGGFGVVDHAARESTRRRS